MRFRRGATIAVTALLLSFSVTMAAQDGTGGPDMATPNPESCDRELVSAEAFDQFEQAEGGVFSASIESVSLTEVDAREDADAESAQAIDETLRSFGACISRYGEIGAYSFLMPEISLGELIYLGVAGASLDDATPLAEGEAGAIVPASSLMPERIVALDDGAIGAVLPAPQPGTEFALLTFVDMDGVWMIASVAPIVADGEGEETGGGGP